MKTLSEIAAMLGVSVSYLRALRRKRHVILNRIGNNLWEIVNSDYRKETCRDSNLKNKKAITFHRKQRQQKIDDVIG